MSVTSAIAEVPAREGSRVVDEVLDEIDRLASSDLRERDFYTALLPKIAALGCPAIAVWVIEVEGQERLAWSSAGAERVEGTGSVLATVNAGQPRVLEAMTSGGAVATGRSIVAPWSAAISTRGALQAWLGERTNAAALSGYLRVLSVVAEIIGAYLDRQQQRRTRRQFEWLMRLDQFVRGLYENLDLKQVAYKIANDGRILLGCDRLTVLIRKGGSFQSLAVSGADHVHRRSDSIHQLEKLAGTVAGSGEDLWHSGRDAAADTLPPQIREALAAYLDVSPATACAVLPLVAKSQRAGGASQSEAVLVCEQYSTEFAEELREMLPLVAEHSRLALQNAQQLSAIPGGRVWRAVRREGWLSRVFSRAAMVGVAISAIVAALLLIPADVRIQARGELQPVNRQEIFAPRDGVVTAIHVHHGQAVTAEEPLLDLRSPELDLEMQRVAGELETARKRLAAAQSERLQTRPTDTDAKLRQRRLTAEEEQLQQQVRDLSDRQKMLEKQREELTVRSPLNGEVVTWNVQQQLASRPLRRGDALITVADTSGEWELELKVPSRRAGRLLAARRKENSPRDVSFVVATSPGRSLAGQLSDVAPRLEMDESGESYLTAKVAVSKAEIENRTPGAGVLARIDCGRSSLAEAWFHDLIDAVQLWLPF